MCLWQAHLSLEPKKFLGFTRYWYGMGYKCINVDLKGFKDRKYKLNRWIRARFSDRIYTDDSNGRYNVYYPGFHVFLDRKSAIDYVIYNEENYIIVPVYFRNIIGFGTNGTGTGYKNFRFDDCVIAQKIYIDKRDFYNPENVLSCIKANQEQANT
jgi:hypothetical protein